MSSEIINTTVTGWVTSEEAPPLRLGVGCRTTDRALSTTATEVTGRKESTVPFSGPGPPRGHRSPRGSSMLPSTRRPGRALRSEFVVGSREGRVTGPRWSPRSSCRPSGPRSQPPEVGSRTKRKPVLVQVRGGRVVRGDIWVVRPETRHLMLSAHIGTSSWTLNRASLTRHDTHILCAI